MKLQNKIFRYLQINN